MFLIMFNARKRLGYFFKVLLALAIIVILITQLAGIVVSAGESYRRWMNRNAPHGNPMKVFKSAGNSIAGNLTPAINLSQKENQFFR